MTNSAPSLMVALVEQAAVVKVSGRANFTTSVSFKRLVTELRERGYDKFILDLTDCVTMDSTFLGILAGTALKLAQLPESSPAAAAGAPPLCSGKLHLLNPNARIIDLLDNLGISDLFRTISTEAASTGESQYVTPGDTPTPTREELSKTCLEAHQLLMALNPDNISKFKEVTQFLAEDVKRLNPEPADAEEPAPVDPGQTQAVSRS